MPSKRALISETIREEILTGRYGPSERLPGVADICARWDVSASTAVGAYRGLDGSGLIERRHGVGYFVTGSVPASDIRPQIVVDAHRKLLALREELDRVIAGLSP